MSKIRVFIVDDQEIVRSGLRRLLEIESEIAVVGEVDNAEDAIHLVQTLNPDVILLDIKLPGMDGISALGALKALAPNAKILMLTIYADGYISSALANGAHGYLLKNISGAELISTV